MSKLEYRNLDLTNGFSELRKQKPFDIKNNLDARRIEKSTIGEAGSLSYNYAALPVDDKIIDALQALADEQQLIDKYKALLGGCFFNNSRILR